MPKLLQCIMLATAAALLACSGPAPTLAPTAPTIPTPEATATPVPAPTPEPTATPVPAPAQEPSATPGPTGETPMQASGPGSIAPLNLEDPKAFMSGLSDAEQSCISENIELERLTALLGAPGLASPGENAALAECLEDETLMRLFLTGLLGESGTLSEETSACVRAGIAGIDLRAMMFAGNEETAMVGGMAAFVLTLSCLNEEEWQAASPALGMSPGDREGLQCVLEELGGPEGMAQALHPPDGGPPIDFFNAVTECGIPMGAGPPGGR